jgi:hypothetical protein
VKLGSDKSLGLGISRLDGENWKDAARRIGRAHGLEHEVMESFDLERECGADEEDAAWAACYEWDVCGLMPR